MRILDIMEIKDLKNPKELEKLKDFIEKKVSSDDCIKFVLRKYFEKEGPSEFQNLVGYCKTAKIHLDDINLEASLRKDKKGTEPLLKEYAKLEKLKSLFLKRDISV